MATKGYNDFEEEDDPITGAIKKSIAGQGQGDLPGAGGLVPGMEEPPPAIAGPVEPPVGPEGPMDLPKANDYTKLGSFKDKMGPWNESNEKFQRPWDEMSERYKMLTILSNFDPSKGVTPEVVDALNKANIKGAKFSGEGDKLSATGLEQWNDYDGAEGLGDVITGFKTGKGTWSPWSPLSKEETQVEMPGLTSMQPGESPLMNQMNGMVPTDESFFQKLLEAAQKKVGAEGGLDREALLSQLGA